MNGQIKGSRHIIEFNQMKPLKIVFISPFVTDKWKKMGEK